MFCKSCWLARHPSSDLRVASTRLNKVPQQHIWRGGRGDTAIGGEDLARGQFVDNVGTHAILPGGRRSGTSFVTISRQNEPHEGGVLGSSWGFMKIDKSIRGSERFPASFAWGLKPPAHHQSPTCVGLRDNADAHAGAGKTDRSRWEPFANRFCVGREPHEGGVLLS